MRYDNDLAVYVAECEALSFGPIGADDCPPADWRPEPRMTRAERAAKRSAEARRRRVKRNSRTRREPGERALRKLCRRAERVGIRTAPTFRAYVVAALDTYPSPDRLARVLRDFAPDLPPRAAPMAISDGSDIPEDWREALDIAAQLDRAEGLA